MSASIKLVKCLLLLSLATRLQGLVCCSSEADEALDRLRDEAGKLPPDGNSQVPDLLTKFKAVYEGYEDEESKDRVQKLTILIGTNRSTLGKCKPDNLFGLVSITDLYDFEFPSSILNYVKRCNAKQFNLCHDMFDEQVEAVVKDLDEHEKLVLDRTVGCVLTKSEGNIEDLSFTAIGECVPSSKLKAMFSSKLSDLRGTCQRLVIKLDKILKSYDIIALDKSLLNKIDSNLKRWLLVGRICRSVELDLPVDD